MVKCENCYYWNYDSDSNGEVYERCMYWFYSEKNIYPSLQDNYPDDKYEDWDCKYYDDRDDMI